MSGFIVHTEGSLPMMAPHRVEPSVVRPDPVEVDGGTQVPFGDLLKDAMQAANTKGMAADRAAQAFASGAVDDIHGTMIAVKEADIQVKLLANVRNKLLDAFYELWRMNV
jgi:flagellar hook-basal body complex protein FliE